MRAFIVNNSVGKSTSNRRITRAFVIAQNGGHAMEVVRDLVDKLNLVQDNHHFGASDIGQMDHAPAEPVHVYESGSVIVYNLFEPMIAVKGVSSVKPSPKINRLQQQLNRILPSQQIRLRLDRPSNSGSLVILESDDGFSLRLSQRAALKILRVLPSDLPANQFKSLLVNW